MSSKSTSRRRRHSSSSSTSSTSEVSNILECCICLDMCSVPILQCVNGHNICASHVPRLLSCPTCRTSYFSGTGRNRLAEKLVEQKNKKRKLTPTNQDPPVDPDLILASLRNHEYTNQNTLQYSEDEIDYYSQIADFDSGDDSDVYVSDDGTVDTNRMLQADSSDDSNDADYGPDFANNFSPDSNVGQRNPSSVHDNQNDDGSDTTDAYWDVGPWNVSQDLGPSDDDSDDCPITYVNRRARPIPDDSDDDDDGAQEEEQDHDDAANTNSNSDQELDNNDENNYDDDDRVTYDQDNINHFEGEESDQSDDDQSGGEVNNDTDISVLSDGDSDANDDEEDFITEENDRVDASDENDDMYGNNDTDDYDEWV